VIIIKCNWYIKKNALGFGYLPGYPKPCRVGTW